jgi:hypothetical protein
MSKPLRRRLAALAMVLLVPGLAACGFNEQTDQVYQPAVGVNNRSGVVDVLGAVVVSGSDGSGTFSASLVNKDQTDAATLASVTGPTGVQIQLTQLAKVEPDSLSNLADIGAVSVSGDDVKAGNFIRMTLQFDTGQETTLNVPVVDRAQEFSQVRPAIPSSSATP